MQQIVKCIFGISIYCNIEIKLPYIYIRHIYVNRLASKTVRQLVGLLLLLSTINAHICEKYRQTDIVPVCVCVCDDRYTVHVYYDFCYGQSQSNAFRMLFIVYSYGLASNPNILSPLPLSLSHSLMRILLPCLIVNVVAFYIFFFCLSIQSLSTILACTFRFISNIPFE